MIEATPHPIVPLRHFAEEAAHRDGQATEALFLTFNADLPFLESRLLDLCRQAGARVSVVADANVWSPDVRSITLAGVRYHVGLIAARTAFHPKISVIAGPERAVAVVGSGNLGMAGWQSNAEIATVISATHDVAPAAMNDLRAALETLAARPELDPLSAAATRRVSDQLAELLQHADVIDTGHRLYVSWDGPLVDRLPSQPVDELLLSAAFHDMDSAAVAHLLNRLRPRVVRVAIQPGRTVVDPTALDRVLAGYASASGADCAVVMDNEPRYRHGKLIEWTVDGARSSLTGSPNLSRVALLAAAPRGNFEVAVVGPTSETLFPPGDISSAPAELPVRAGFGPGEERGRLGPTIVSAVLIRDGLRLQVARSTVDAVVEVSRFASPDSWHTLASAPAASATLELHGEFRGGDRVRLGWQDPSGAQFLSAPAFVMDLATVLARTVDRAHAPKVKHAMPTDLWGDDLSFLESVLDELNGLAEQLAGAAPPSSGTARRSPVPADDTTGRKADAWLWIRDEAVETLGAGIGPYGLGLPPLTTPGTAALPDWTDESDLSETTDLSPEEDQGETDASSEREGADEPTKSADDHSESPPRIRKARQRWCSRAANIAPKLDVQYRLLVLRITLRLWHLGNWDEGDASPLRLIARMTSCLTDPNPPGRLDPPAELTVRVASLATVALALLHPDDGRGDEEKRDIYRSLRDSVATLVPAASEEQLETYSKGIVDPADLDDVLYVAHTLRDDASSGDRLGELERQLWLEDSTKSISRPSLNELHLVADIPKASIERRALVLLGKVEEHNGIGIRVSNLDNEWALAAWNAPDLIRVTAYPNGRLRWKYHRLRPLTTPSSIAGEEFRGQKVELGQPRPEADAAVVLDSMGIAVPTSSTTD
ncbi:hypothetical protein ACFT30_12675 [Microbacterium ureisolvens]|uniref:hypothetical protein n=1 Tax=Microbacterium ureisolvens TaxID=2781186 RepID=UPI00363CC958